MLVEALANRGARGDHFERPDQPGFLPSLELCYVVPGVRHWPDCTALAGPVSRQWPGAGLLTARELNRALLARQMLLERVKAPAAPGARADGRAPGAVRPVDVHRALVAAWRASSERPSRERSSAASVVQGTAHAVHHPPGLEGRLLAALRSRSATRACRPGASTERRRPAVRQEDAGGVRSAYARGSPRSRRSPGPISTRCWARTRVITNGDERVARPRARPAARARGSGGGPTSSPSPRTGSAPRRAPRRRGLSCW